MRKQTISTTGIIEATILFIAENGIQNVSTRKIADSIHIAEGSIFNYFPTKTNLLENCFYYVNSQIDHVLKNVSFHGFSIAKNVKIMWYNYFEFFVTHGNYTKFYHYFRQSSYYNEEVKKSQTKSFTFFADLVQKNSALLGTRHEIFWVFVIETTLTFAVRVVDGGFSADPKDMDQYFDFIAYGMTGLFKKSKNDKLYF